MGQPDTQRRVHFLRMIALGICIVKEDCSMRTDMHQPIVPQSDMIGDISDVYLCEEEVNKSIVRRWYAEVVNEGNLSALDWLVADDIVMRMPLPDLTPGRAEVRMFLGTYLAAFPVQFTEIDVLIAAGSRVVAQHTRYVAHSDEFMRLSPTDREATVSGVTIFRLADRRIMELWLLDDMLSMLRR